MPLDGRVVDVDHFDQLVEGHIPHVVLLAGQEAGEDTDSKDSQALAGFDVHDSLDTLGKH